MSSDTDVSAELGPAEPEMELALLALAMTDNAVMDRLGRLEAEDFADPLHGVAFAAMQELRSEGRTISLVNMQAKVGSVVFADGTGLLDALKAHSFQGTHPDAHELAEHIRDRSLRRQIMQRGRDTVDAVWNNADTPGAIIAARMTELDGLLSKCRPQGKVLWSAMEAMDDLAAYVANPPANERLLCGLADLDNMLGGLVRGEYGILAGRPSMGKTALAVTIGTGAALGGNGVLIFSLEMSVRAWVARMAADAAWDAKAPLPYADALRGRLCEGDSERFIQGAKARRTLPLIMNEQAGLSMAEIAAFTRTATQAFERQGHQLGLVIVDHIGKVKPSTNYRGNKVHEVGEISNALATLAKRENVAVLALCQLNRGVEGRENKRPGLADLRDTGDIEQDADAVMFAYRASYYLQRQKEDDAEKERLRHKALEMTRNDLELIIAKQRNGMTGVVQLYVDMASNVVRNAAIANQKSRPA